MNIYMCVHCITLKSSVIENRIFHLNDLEELKKRLKLLLFKRFALFTVHYITHISEMTLPLQGIILAAQIMLRHAPLSIHMRSYKLYICKIFMRLLSNATDIQFRIFNIE